jgi:hypothetical protein
LGQRIDDLARKDDVSAIDDIIFLDTKSPDPSAKATEKSVAA